MKIKLADVIVRVREVEFPDTCPRCGTDLTDPEAVFAYRLEHVSYHTAIVPDMVESLKYVDSNYEPVYDAFTYVTCAKCAGEKDCAFVTNEEKVLNPDPVEIARLHEESVWSKSVDSVILGGNNF